MNPKGNLLECSVVFDALDNSLLFIILFLVTAKIFSFLFTISSFSFLVECLQFYYFYTFYLVIFQRERERERERERGTSICCSAYLCIHSASSVCPDQRSNLQPWHMETALLPTELPSFTKNSFTISNSFNNSIEYASLLNIHLNDSIKHFLFLYSVASSRRS